MTIIRTYSELAELETFEERFDYLKLGGSVGHATFGHDRFLNQRFYLSPEWKRARDYAIVRDDGCDLGIIDRPIHSGVLVHHINPIMVDDIIHGAEWILDPEYLITTNQRTHNAIHYSDPTLIREPYVDRMPGDTTPWSR